MASAFTDVEPPEVSFWEDKHSELVHILSEDIPSTGEVKDKKRPVLEDWRILQNAYYRCYNDGDAFVTKLRNIAQKYNTTIRNSGKSLEALADVVFMEALIEKFNSLNGVKELDVEQIGTLIKQKLTHDKETA